MFLFSQNRLGGLIQKGFKILLAKQPVAIGRVDHHRDPAVIGPCSKSVLADTEHVRRRRDLDVLVEFFLHSFTLAY